MNNRYTAQCFLPSTHSRSRHIINFSLWEISNIKCRAVNHNGPLRHNFQGLMTSNLYTSVSSYVYHFHTNENFVQNHKESMLIITYVTSTYQLYYANYMAVFIFVHQKYCIKFHPQTNEN
jgi:hypothetical protein